MEFLNAVNLEQLGTAGVMIAYLVYLIHQKGKEINVEREERKFWQEKAFDVSRSSQAEVAEACATLDRALDLLQRQT
jgi:two-component SAPR family response regulator